MKFLWFVSSLNILIPPIRYFLFLSFNITSKLKLRPSNWQVNFDILFRPESIEIVKLTLTCYIFFFIQVEDNICKFAKKGLTPSQIGVILRDSHGIAQVNSVTGSKILRILKGHGMHFHSFCSYYHWCVVKTKKEITFINFVNFIGYL